MHSILSFLISIINISTLSVSTYGITLPFTFRALWPTATCYDHQAVKFRISLEYRCYPIKKIFPAIKERFFHTWYVMKIQKDNAYPRISSNDSEFVKATERLGLYSKLVCQPTDSPDLNILDLGYLNSNCALQHQEVCLRIFNELVLAVNTSHKQIKVR